MHPPPRRDIDVISVVPQRGDEAIVQKCGEALNYVERTSNQHQDGREQVKAGDKQAVLRLAGACGTVSFSLGSHLDTPTEKSRLPMPRAFPVFEIDAAVRDTRTRYFGLSLKQGERLTGLAWRREKCSHLTKT